jgi:hypothetical protein
MFRIVPLVAAAGLFATAARAADADWQFEQVRLTNGAVLRGLILDETPARITFQNVRRQPGRPTVVFTTTLDRSEIAAVDRLPAADRDRLRARLHELEEAAPAEKQREERLELEPIAWGGKAGAGRRYRSEHFVLESNAPEWMVRRAAGRLEQVYAAYARFLPPRTPPSPLVGEGGRGGEGRPTPSPPDPLSHKGKGGGTPTVIELCQSRAGYEARLKGRQIVNVAIYDPAVNRILCYCDLERLGTELDKSRQQHQKMRADLDKQEKELARLYRGAELGRVLIPIRDTRKKLDAADRQNENLFDQVSPRLFTVLNHEAFHAYLASVVYPAPEAGPPRWLNEGLAQIFETAVVEAGELRVGHADRDRLARVKEAIRKGELVPLSRLLRSSPRDFLAAHASDREATDTHYLTAWAVAFHLTFERHLLGKEALDRYFQALAKGTDPEAAFADLVGESAPAYEAGLYQYLLQLQPDGTVAGPRPEK